MKIICIGRNYVNHAKEMNSPIPTEPVVFMKPSTAILHNNDPFYYPSFTKELHYEVELVIKICKHGRSIEKEFAANYYAEIGLGIDLTARDVQRACKEKGLPWEKAKSFDHSAVINQFYPIENFKKDNIPFRLEKNGTLVQSGNSKEMIFDFDHIISYVSTFFKLNIGDLIFTGTPEGVGPLQIGDELVGYLADQKVFMCEIK